MSKVRPDNQVHSLISELRRCESNRRVKLAPQTIRLLRENLCKQTEPAVEFGERYAHAIDAAEIGAFEYDLITRQIRANGHLLKMVGVSDESQLNNLNLLFQTVHPEDRDQLEQKLEQACQPRECGLGDGATTSHFQGEFRINRQDTVELRWILGRGAVLFYADGSPGRIFGACIDITQRKECELRTEEANKAKDQFIANLSHELRAPLSPVLMAVEALMKDRNLSPDLRETAEMIYRNVSLESRLIEDLLDITRINNKKLVIKASSVDVHEIICQVLAMCENEIRGKSLTVKLEPMAHPATAFVDPARLQQMVWNLIRNAVKFTPADGRICIATRRDISPEFISICVSDSGVGIAEDMLGRVFNRFEQGGSQITRQFGGLGLGLAITKALVEMQDGTIEAYSEGPGKGAAFTLRLPTAATGSKEDGSSEWVHHGSSL